MDRRFVFSGQDEDDDYDENPHRIHLNHSHTNHHNGVYEDNDFFDQLDPDLRRDSLRTDTQSPFPDKQPFTRGPRKYLNLNEDDSASATSDLPLAGDSKRRSSFRQLVSKGQPAQQDTPLDTGKSRDHRDQILHAFRKIYLNDPLKNAQRKWLHNRISTAKYNALTFLPKFLYEQFSKYANIFFLFTACVQVCFCLFDLD